MRVVEYGRGVVGVLVGALSAIAGCQGNISPPRLADDGGILPPPDDGGRPVGGDGQTTPDGQRPPPPPPMDGGVADDHVFVPSGTPRPWVFTEVSGSTGMQAAVAAVADRTFELDVQDYDGDGDIDVLVGDHAGILPWTDGSRLFRNDGKWTFIDVTASAFAGIANGRSGNLQDALSADLDGDGMMDLITTSNDGVGWMYRGTGPFRFAGFTAFTDWQGHVAGRGVSLADIDRDGDLDMFLSNHGNEAPELYRNNGTTWTLASMPPGEFKSSIQPYFADFDGDGIADLLLTEFIGFGHGDPDPPAEAHFLVGRGDGTFVDATGTSRIGLLAYVNCPLAVGDVDRDGDPDIVQIGVPHDRNTRALLGTTASVKLLLNDGAGVFRDATTEATGLAGTFSGGNLFWAKGLIEDMDNDGLADIVMYPTSPVMFRNRGGLRFERVSPPGMTHGGESAVAAADLEQDGNLDLLFTMRNDAPEVKVWRNELNSARALRIRLRSNQPKNLAGIGSSIWVYDTGHLGEVAHLRGHRQVMASSNNHAPYEQHVGLGDAAGAVDVRVRWPDGEITDHRAIQPGRIVLLTR